MRRSEKGRSMVEMLGVLAIIGVLSVGGIYGYTVAMNKYKANEVAQGAAMLATLARGRNAGAGLQGQAFTGADAGLYPSTGANNNIQGCTLSAAQATGSDKVTVTVTCTGSNADAIESAVLQLNPANKTEFEMVS